MIILFMNSKWVSIKFRLWATRSKLVNMDIYFLDVSKGNKTEMSKSKIHHQGEQIQSVGDSFSIFQDAWISFGDASFFPELNIIEMHWSFLLWITCERWHLLPINCRRRQFFFLDTCLYRRVDGRVTGIQSIDLGLFITHKPKYIQLVWDAKFCCSTDVSYSFVSLCV